MRKFRITVNGRAYEVDVEEIGGAAVSMPPVVTMAAPAPAPVAAPAPAPVPAPAPAPAANQEPVKEVKQEAKPAPAAPVAGGETISAPMPGTILDVRVKEGDTVKKGSVMFILEAMKMENEIMSPRDGKVARVGVSKGASVNTADMLAVIQ